MGEFEVLQRTSDLMFNATALLKQWNESHGSKKEIKEYFSNKSTNELIEEMTNDSEFLNRGNSPYLKSKGKYNGGTWMHPLLFIDFAMWINPKFKLTVLKFVQDELIKTRHEAGDEYVNLSKSISQIIKGKKDPKYYSKVAEAINCIVFNKKEKNLRQNATISELKELRDLEVFIISSIECGLIKSYDHLIHILRSKWKNKYMPI